MRERRSPVNSWTTSIDSHHCFSDNAFMAFLIDVLRSAAVFFKYILWRPFSRRHFALWEDGENEALQCIYARICILNWQFRIYITVEEYISQCLLTFFTHTYVQVSDTLNINVRLGISSRNYILVLISPAISRAISLS